MGLKLKVFASSKLLFSSLRTASSGFEKKSRELIFLCCRVLDTAKFNLRARKLCTVILLHKEFCFTIQFVFNGYMIHVNASIKYLIGNNKNLF